MSEFDQDFGNQNVVINTSPAENKDEKSSDTRNEQLQSRDSKINSSTPSRQISLQQALTNKFSENAKEQMKKSWLDQFICCFNWLKKYFQITSKDFTSRILQSIIPFNTKLYQIIENSPDFYGPFWIYTTFIVLVSSCGSLTRTIQGDRDENFFQVFIPNAAVLIYSIGFGVPILITLLAKLFGGKISIAPVICIYGYSYTIFLPIIIVCSIPNELLQWLLLLYAIFSSTSLIIMSIFKTFQAITEGKKIALIIIICIFQIIVFFVLKLYFFKHLNKELLGEGSKDLASNSTLTNSTTTNTKEKK